jgi:hypothetical protein
VISLKEAIPSSTEEFSPMKFDLVMYNRGLIVGHMLGTSSSFVPHSSASAFLAL